MVQCGISCEIIIPVDIPIKNGLKEFLKTMVADFFDTRINIMMSRYLKCVEVDDY